MALLLRILLSALAVFFVLPMIDGITFHGNFIEAIGIGAFFALMLWVVAKLAQFLSAVFAVGTLGLGLLILIPLWVFGFWLLPAVALKLVADVMPAYLTVSGWWPAIWGGLVMLFVSAFSGGFSVKVTTKKSD